MLDPLPYIPGHSPAKPGPLARYLPPIPAGVASAWLASHLPGGAWVLDPFGAQPHLPIEAARAGYRVLVAANNPVARFLLEITAKPPSRSELSAALADLASSYKGEERIEPHIRALYITECAGCGKAVMADAFLWERGAAAPFARIYRCPYCGDSGERQATEKDTARTARFSSSGLHRARALERVAPPNDPDRQHAEEALATYLPRAVYALFTLINKLDSFSSSTEPAVRHHLSALLLAALDQANTLWPHPTARARPRQLTIPPHFRENNVWLAMEESIEQWAASDAPNNPGLPFTIWPELPPESGGICLFEGRLKELGENLAQVRIEAVLAALPRPNQAFWTLSALWAGWLWGKEAAAPFKSVLRRRRYDWAWHSTALGVALENLAPRLVTGTPFLGLIGESEPGFLSSALIAAELTGFDLDGLSLRAEEGQAQILWHCSEKRQIDEHLSTGLSPAIIQTIQDTSRKAAWTYLRQRGEPASYLQLHVAALSALVQTGEIQAASSPPAELLGQVQNAFQQVFTYRNGFVRFGGSEHSLEVGQWWLRDENKQVELPLADRVEMALVRYLQKHPGCSLEALEAILCEQFPGLLTPNRSLIEACLDSYGEQKPQGSNRWQFRAQDAPGVRRSDLRKMYDLLTQLGQRLGYLPGEGPSEMHAVVWRDLSGKAQYVFFILASAVLGKIIFDRRFSPTGSILVLPGGRAGLVAFKLRSDERIKLTISQGWRFVKFRHVRHLAENRLLTRENLAEQLALDPLSNRDPQLPLL